MTIDDLHTCHSECQRPACVAVREAVAAELKPVAWKGLSTAEVKTLWNLTKKPSEFAEMLQAKLKEKNAADA